MWTDEDLAIVAQAIHDASGCTVTHARPTDEDEDSARAVLNALDAAGRLTPILRERPTVGMMNFDAAAVLRGRTMGCSTLDGAQVLVRLWTAEELYDRAQQVKRDGDPGMTMAQAVELTTPIGRN